MDLDDIIAQMDRIFASRPARGSREEAAGLHEALIEFKVAIGQLREGLTQAEGQLDGARREVADAERRGRMAADIEDSETARIAEEYVAKMRERVDLLERKVLVLRDELHLAEREYEITKARFQSARAGTPLGDSRTEGPALSAEHPSSETSSPMDEYLIDQRAREAAVEAQLAHLKKKLSDRS